MHFIIYIQEIFTKYLEMLVKRLDNYYQQDRMQINSQRVPPLSTFKKKFQICVKSLFMVNSPLIVFFFL